MIYGSNLLLRQHVPQFTALGFSSSSAIMNLQFGDDKLCQYYNFVQGVLADPPTTESPDGHVSIRTGPQSSGRRWSALISPLFFYILWSASSPGEASAEAVRRFGTALCSGQPSPPGSGKLPPDDCVLFQQDDGL